MYIIYKMSKTEIIKTKELKTSISRLKHNSNLHLLSWQRFAKWKTVKGHNLQLLQQWEITISGLPNARIQSRYSTKKLNTSSCVCNKNPYMWLMCLKLSNDEHISGTVAKHCYNVITRLNRFTYLHCLQYTHGVCVFARITLTDLYI